MDEQQQVEDIVKCSDCGSRSLTRDETRGEVVCDDCGLVLEDNVIDQGAEWRVFSPEQGDQRARTGAPMTVMLHDKGLSTDIDWQNKDYSGKTINSRYFKHFTQAAIEFNTSTISWGQYQHCTISHCNVIT